MCDPGAVVFSEQRQRNRQSPGIFIKLLPLPLLQKAHRRVAGRLSPGAASFNALDDLGPMARLNTWIHIYTPYYPTYDSALPGNPQDVRRLTTGNSVALHSLPRQSLPATTVVIKSRWSVSTGQKRALSSSTNARKHPAASIYPTRSNNDSSIPQVAKPRSPSIRSTRSDSKAINCYYKPFVVTTSSTRPSTATMTAIAALRTNAACSS